MKQHILSYYADQQKISHFRDSTGKTYLTDSIESSDIDSFVEKQQLQGTTKVHGAIVESDIDSFDTKTIANESSRITETIEDSDIDAFSSKNDLFSCDKIYSLNDSTMQTFSIEDSDKSSLF